MPNTICTWTKYDEAVATGGEQSAESIRGVLLPPMQARAAHSHELAKHLLMLPASGPAYLPGLGFGDSLPAEPP